jgi:HAD superfamily hydrolase (TIGR01459 family)
MQSTSLKKITDLIDQYDVFVFDIWGVLISDDQSVYPGVVDTFNKLIDTKPVYLLSNSPRSRMVSWQRLVSMGFNIPMDHIFTSGELSGKMLLEHKNSFNFDFELLNLYHVVENVIEDILKDTKIVSVLHPSEANAILITTATEDKNEIANIYQKLDLALKYNLPAICSNPDLFLSDFRYCAGFFAEYYKEKGGIVHYVGKPYANIFEYLYNNIKQTPDRSKMILIGDTLYTDILGAKNFGIHSGLVLTGNAKVLTNLPSPNFEQEIAILRNEAAKQNLMPNHFISLST